MHKPEYWSLYDEHLRLQVERHPANQPIPADLYHLSVEVWPFDGRRFFLTKRSARKKKYPGFWECTGGSVWENESFLDGAMREVREELGIVTDAEDYHLLKTEKKDCHFVSVFLLDVDRDTDFSLSESEIETGKWHTVQELESLHLDSNFIPYQFDRYLRYVRSVAFSAYMASKPGSITRITAAHPELQMPKRGLPDTGTRPDKRQFSGTLGEIAEAFDVYRDTLYTSNTILPETVNNSLGSGSPLKSRPFPPVAQAIRRVMESEVLSQYAFPAGDLSCRRSICEYLRQEGFSSSVTPDSIIFTESTTHAFHMVLELILRPGDVVLFTAPTYGLFAFDPERCRGESRFLPLREEDDWFVNPNRLAERIDEINRELAENSDSANYPRVAAFFQENPHNPLGKVMGPRQKNLVRRIAEVCRERDVFLIDDLLYRDLGYDRDNLALPAAHFDSEWENVISLIGLSKAYGLAGMRAGMIIADEVIIRGIRNLVFQEIDSASHLNAVALEAAFNVSRERQEAYEAYFRPLLADYQFRYHLMEAAIRGVDRLEAPVRNQVTEYVVNVLGREEGERWLRPIRETDFVRGTTPESGFFCLVDFSAYRGKHVDGTVISDDTDFLRYLFGRYRINFITGKSIGWPDREAIIARFSFSCDPEKIIRVFAYMKQELLRIERKDTCIF